MLPLAEHSSTLKMDVGPSCKSQCTSTRQCHRPGKARTPFILLPLYPGIFGSVYFTYVHPKLTHFLCLPLTSHCLGVLDICHTNHDTVQKQTKSTVCLCLTYFAYLYLASFLPSTDPYSGISPLVLDLGQLFSILLQYEQVYLLINPPNLQTIEL